MLYFLLLLKDNWKKIFLKLSEFFHKKKEPQAEPDPMPKKSTKYDNDSFRDEESSDIRSDNLAGFLPGPETRSRTNSDASFYTVTDTDIDSPPNSRGSFSSLPSLDLTISKGLQAQRKRQDLQHIAQELNWKRVEVNNLLKYVLDLFVSGEKPQKIPSLEEQLKAKIEAKEKEPRLMPELPKRTQRSMLHSYRGSAVNAKEYVAYLTPNAKKHIAKEHKKDQPTPLTLRKYLYERAIYKNPLGYLVALTGMDKNKTPRVLKTSEEIAQQLQNAREAVTEIIKKPSISSEHKKLNWDSVYTLIEPTDLESVEIYSGRNRHLFMEKYDRPKAKVCR